MRRVIPYTLGLAVLCGLLSLCASSGRTVVAQKADDEEPKEYVRVSAAEIEQRPSAFDGTHVQVADIFYRELERFPRALRRYDVTAKTHRCFLTHRVLGSNMICLVSRENEAAEKVLGHVIEESNIYMLGRVGPRIDTGKGYSTVFMADEVHRGHVAPPPKRVTKKKALKFTLEWEVTVGRSVRTYKKLYRIPEPGKRYKIKDPYSDKYLYMTFQF